MPGVNIAGINRAQHGLCRAASVLGFYRVNDQRMQCRRRDVRFSALGGRYREQDEQGSLDNTGK